MMSQDILIGILVHTNNHSPPPLYCVPRNQTSGTVLASRPTGRVATAVDVGLRIGHTGVIHDGEASGSKSAVGSLHYHQM